MASGPSRRPNPWAHRRHRPGYRPDLGRVFRSALEADTARLLNALQQRGLVRRWEYESRVLRFPGQRGRVRGYLPDFWVETSDGQMWLIETKGKLDPRSRRQVELARAAGFRVVVLRREGLERLADRFLGKGLRLPNWRL